MHTVFFGSAITGAGVGQLVDGITAFLPAGGGDEDEPVSATVFKIDRSASGEKMAYVRLFSGTLHTRDRFPVGRGRGDRVTAIQVFEDGTLKDRSSVSAGHSPRSGA